jgi:hypothetical protein
MPTTNKQQSPTSSRAAVVERRETGSLRNSRQQPSTGGAAETQPPRKRDEGRALVESSSANAVETTDVEEHWEHQSGSKEERGIKSMCAFLGTGSYRTGCR